MIGHLKVWIEKDPEKRVQLMLDLIEDFEDLLILHHLEELGVYSDVQAI